MQKLRSGSRSRRHAERDEIKEDILAIKASNRDRNNAAASSSDVEKEAGKLASLSPAKVTLPKEVKIEQISSGLHHTLMLSSKGEVFVFGSNSHGQLGLCDLIPRGVPTKVRKLSFIF